MRRIMAALSVAALAAALTGGPAQAEPDDPGAAATEPVLELTAPKKADGYAVENFLWVIVNANIISPGAPFEVWANRPSYDDPITAVWKAPGGDVALPDGMVGWSGFTDFMRQKLVRVKDGKVVYKQLADWCPNSYSSQRVKPDAQPRNPYPTGCPYNPYTLGSVMGIPADWAAGVSEYLELANKKGFKPGKYELTIQITKKYQTFFGIDPADASKTIKVKVQRYTEEDAHGIEQLEGLAQANDTGSDDANVFPVTPAGGDPVIPEQPGAEPDKDSAGAANGDFLPDLRSLPAFGISLNKKGTQLRFAATVWNGGHGPMVVDGFRDSVEEEHMDAYQYYFDADGNQTGYDKIEGGGFHWHTGNHNHWHFDDFARYRLLNADQTQAVKSGKRSFCLANTDAVDYTVPNADWRPENTDLEMDCGQQGSLSLRQMLSNGSGDTYAQYRSGQAFGIKNLPNGVYYIAVEANPRGLLNEVDKSNNVSLRKIKLSGKGENRKVKVSQVGIVDEYLCYSEEC